MTGKHHNPQGTYPAKSYGVLVQDELLREDVVQVPLEALALQAVPELPTLTHVTIVCVLGGSHCENAYTANRAEQ